MSKYGNGLTFGKVCKLECEEAKGILDAYKVSKGEQETILDMIKEAYFQCMMANRANHAINALLVREYETHGKDTKFIFSDYLVEVPNHDYMLADFYKDIGYDFEGDEEED